MLSSTPTTRCIPPTPHRLSRRLARATLGLAGASLLGLACSSAPSEQTGATSSAISDTLLTRSSYEGQIVNTNGGCLDLPNGEATNGNLLHIWACDSSGWNQTWFVDAQGSIHYAANPEKCVDFPSQDLVNGIPTDETQLQIWDCNGASGPDQVWTPSLGEQIEFSADTKKCVELRNGSSANGTAVQVYDCNGTSGQTWQLVQGGGLQGFQVQDGNGACLGAPSATSGAGLVLEQCSSTGANQTWYADGKGGIYFGSQYGLCASVPAADLTTAAPGFVPMSQLQLLPCNSQSGGQSLRFDSAHNLVVGTGCVEARNGASTNGTVVQGYTCNGTTGQTWYPKPVGGACPGTVSGDGTCNACGGVGQAPCAGAQVGCNAGLVEAVTNDWAVPRVASCAAACGNVGQLPCFNGPLGYQNGEWQGGCTQWDAVMYTNSDACQLPTTCGHENQACCDAGSYFQGPNSTTDICRDGSTCTYEGFPGAGSWQCVPPNSGGGSSSGGSSSGGTVTCGEPYQQVCSGGSCNETTEQLCNAGGVCEPPDCSSCDPDDLDDCCVAFCGEEIKPLPADGRAPASKRRAGVEGSSR